MSKARIIGAGTAGSTIYHCNVNLNTAGGTKKQGLPFSLDTPTINKHVIRLKATGDKRHFIFTMNQLTGGVGHTKYYRQDGIHPKEPYRYQN
jgi:hypothetical protein